MEQKKNHLTGSQLFIALQQEGIQSTRGLAYILAIAELGEATAESLGLYMKMKNWHHLTPQLNHYKKAGIIKQTGTKKINNRGHKRNIFSIDKKGQSIIKLLAKFAKNT